MRSRIILILLLVVALTACGGSSSAGGKTRVVAAFYPVAYAAARLGGPGVVVQNLTPPGVEPHDLEATPSTVRAVKEADHVLLLGHGFQPQLEAAAGNGPKVVHLLDTPGLRLHPADPHVWLGPPRYALIVKGVAVALGRPQAAAPVIARLHALDRQYRSRLEHCRRHEIVTSH